MGDIILCNFAASAPATVRGKTRHGIADGRGIAGVQFQNAARHCGALIMGGFDETAADKIIGATQVMCSIAGAALQNAARQYQHCGISIEARRIVVWYSIIIWCARTA